jgi:predicted DNA-binding transcriptional regulator AlpA
MSSEAEKYLTGPDVDRRYGRSSQSRWRWSKDPELAFPTPLKIKGRNFYRISDLEEWEARLAAASDTFKPVGAAASSQLSLFDWKENDTFESVGDAAGRVVDKLSRGQS